MFISTMSHFFILDLLEEKADVVMYLKIKTIMF